MLIRLANDEIVEYPDELGALVLAEPIHGDVPDFSPEELNCVLNCNLALIYDESMTLDENIQKAHEFYSTWGPPTDANLAKACDLVKKYNAKITVSEIGYVSKEIFNEFYGIQSSHPKAEGNIINQEPLAKLFLGKTIAKTCIEAFICRNKCINFT
jgi:hypothetical protein